MSAKYIPLTEVVAMFLDQYDKSSGDEDKAMVMAYRGLEDMHFNIASEPKTVRIPDNGNKTFSFPADYVSWCKIGLLNQNGELITLTQNKSLTTFRDNNPNRLSLRILGRCRLETQAHLPLKGLSHKVVLLLLDQ